jgi:hypothetical protein
MFLQGILFSLSTLARSKQTKAILYKIKLLKFGPLFDASWMMFDVCQTNMATCLSLISRTQVELGFSNVSN